MENTENKLLQAALNYAALGLAVFPLRPGEKRPAFKGWQDSSTTDPATIRDWWTQNPAFNIGIDCGKSGLLVLDFDAANGKEGLTIREEWRRTHILPDTMTAKTPRGGIHEYYRGQGPTKTGLYNGVDVRGAGGLVAAPPSVFNGKAYTWEKPPVLFPLADADSSVYTFLSPVPEGFDRQKAPYTVPETIPEGQRTAALVQLAGSLIGKGLSPEAAEAAIQQENALRCDPPLTDEELQREVFPALHREKWQTSAAPYTRDLPINTSLLEKLRALDTANNKRYTMTDIGAARLFMDVCGDCVQYAADRKKWLFFDGRRWNADGENAVRETLKALADALTVYALRDVADDRRDGFLKWACKWQQLRQRETILKDASSVRPVKSEQFDRLPLVLNVQNGTLDLETFTLRPHSAADMLSRMAAVSYDPAATSDRWARFIDEITAGDKETARYLQKAAGYALTGSTEYECMFILYGAGARNGKSTFLETLAAMMGDYSAGAKAESFAKQKYANGNQHSEDIARLAGARFVTVPEPPKNMELNSALAKSLTGGDRITARRLNEGSFEYVPVFKLFFNTNHRPRIDDLTVFASDRIKLIPFTRHFAEAERDTTLKATLKKPENLSAVLNWALTGLHLLRSEGFSMPPAVVQATNEYRHKMDKLAQFMDERTETGADYETPLMLLHTEFANWCSASGLMSVSIPKFRELLEEKQILFKRKRPNDKTISKNPTWMVLGLRITQQGPEN